MDGLIDDSNGEMFTHMFEFMADGEMKVSEMKEFLAKKLKVMVYLTFRDDRAHKKEIM